MKIWGGRDLESFRDNLPEGNIGESWDVACHTNGMSVVKNGRFKGKTLETLIKEYPQEILGDNNFQKKFPLMVKLINSREKLSVQVHPDDNYAKDIENSSGKTEALYVLEAKPGASLIIGTKDCDKDTFKNAVKDGNIEKYLNQIEVKKGDFFLVNSGLVHAILEDVVIVEIQQNSDITYRIFDYGRPRELQLDKALDVIDFNLKVFKTNQNITKNCKDYKMYNLCKNKYFVIDKYVINKELIDKTYYRKFYILTCVEGSGVIKSKSDLTVTVDKGDSVLIPASLGNYTIQGKLTLLKSYV